MADGGSIERRAAAAGLEKSRRIDPGLCGPHGALAGHLRRAQLDRRQGARRAPNYTRYDYTAWGEPIRSNGFAADGRWFGATPETIVAVDGEAAARLIPKIRNVIEHYRFRTYGDYSAWPGPNSNTFVRAVLDAVPS